MILRHKHSRRRNVRYFADSLGFVLHKPALNHVRLWRCEHCKDDYSTVLDPSTISAERMREVERIAREIESHQSTTGQPFRSKTYQHHRLVSIFACLQEHGGGGASSAENPEEWMMQQAKAASMKVLSEDDEIPDPSASSSCDGAAVLDFGESSPVPLCGFLVEYKGSLGHRSPELGACRPYEARDNFFLMMCQRRC
eukprot:symbB.v1.2.038588.t1/scaffold6065.1/size21245/2